MHQVHVYVFVSKFRTCESMCFCSKLRCVYPQISKIQGYRKMICSVILTSNILRFRTVCEKLDSLKHAPVFVDVMLCMLSKAFSFTFMSGLFPTCEIQALSKISLRIYQCLRVFLPYSIRIKKRQELPYMFCSARCSTATAKFHRSLDDDSGRRLCP